ncbi:MAG: energy-coupling factor transporter ATPase [Anaerolineales bacterium]|jgi:energy-coupling factor transporter ATP-binding protein EcfA2
MKSVIFKDFSFTYLHQEAHALSNVTLELDEGRVIGIIGRAGAGKSTLVKALDGLVPQVELGLQEGDVIVDGKNTREHEVNQMAYHVGLVLQNPEIQIFSLKVKDDVAFGPANLGVPKDEIFRRVESALRETELEHLAERNPNDLSGGEQQSLAIAGLLAMQPKVMAFDEPISMLDPLGKEQVMNVMRQVTKRNGTTSITTEAGSDIEAVAEVVDHLVAIHDGRVMLEGTPEEVLQTDLMDEIGVGRPQVTELFIKLKRKGIQFEHIPITLEQAYEILKVRLRKDGVTKIVRPPWMEAEIALQPEFGETVVEVENLHHFYNPSVHALKGVSFTIPKGQIVGIIGQNGSGKTTLARHLVGLLKPTNEDAKLRVLGEDITKLRIDKIIKKINYVFQNPDDQLFAETIWDEIAFAPRMMELDEDEIARLTEEALKVFELDKHADRYVFGLDEDLKTYLAISCILPLQPEVLLIDEPTTGLDTHGEARMMESLTRLRNEMGKTIVIITHNMKTVGNHCDRVLVMSRGNMILDGTPREIFAKDKELLEGDIRPPQITRLGQLLAAEFECPKDILTVDEMVDILAYSLKPENQGV